MLSNQPLPYLGKGCPYCGRDDLDFVCYDYADDDLTETFRCSECHRTFSLGYTLKYWEDDKREIHPISVMEYTDLPLARAVYPEVVNDLLDRVASGHGKYGCVLSTHNGRSALQDVYEEIMDALLYIKQKLMEESNDSK